MLRKLLKYDFKSIIKIWFILSLSIVAFSVPVGYAMKIATEPREIPIGLEILSTLGTIILFLGLIAYVLITGILIFKRFYKNFFTDEGYLTFTLPSNRNQLLFSKVLFGSISYSATIMVAFVALYILLRISIGEALITINDWKELVSILNEGLRLGTGVSVLYIITVLFLIIVIFILANCVSVIFLYLCITIASIITKKNKVLTAIGIYYLTNSVLSFVLMMFSLFGISGISYWIQDLTDTQEAWFILLSPLLIGLFLALIVVGLYLIIYRLLDKKLNLT